ncbi:hypothetical protein VCHC02C1_2594B, partial [Vibrio cholerae HC-02C1]
INTKLNPDNPSISDR